MNKKKPSRKSTGKKLRFEIFKRDGFRCVYCGSTPVQSVLRIDHVIPVADGGETNHVNLVTSCHDCNAGKGSTPLEKRHIEKTMLTESHREHGEQIREYLRVQKEIAEARRESAEELADFWQDTIGPMSEDNFNRLSGLVHEWPTEKLIEAILIVSRKFGKMYQFSAYDATNRAKYFNGILRKWRAEAIGG
jgi:HNH endonuclease